MSSKSPATRSPRIGVYTAPAVAAGILHVSDLHCGRRETPEMLAALRELAARIDPELVLATGDLSHRGRREQLESASEQLRGLGVPSSRCQGTTTSRTRALGALHAHVRGVERLRGPLSLRTRRSDSTSSGHARSGRGDSRAARCPRSASPASRPRSVTRPPARCASWRSTTTAALPACPAQVTAEGPATACSRRLAAAGAELVVGGHVHQAGIAERREFEALEDDGGSAVVLATVPGLGRPRPQPPR